MLSAALATDTFALWLQLNVLHAQALALQRSRWRGQLTVEYQSGLSLTLSYWRFACRWRAFKPGSFRPQRGIDRPAR